MTRIRIHSWARSVLGPYSLSWSKMRMFSWSKLHTLWQKESLVRLTSISTASNMLTVLMLLLHSWKHLPPSLPWTNHFPPYIVFFSPLPRKTTNTTPFFSLYIVPPNPNTRELKKFNSNLPSRHHPIRFQGWYGVAVHELPTWQKFKSFQESWLNPIDPTQLDFKRYDRIWILSGFNHDWIDLVEIQSFRFRVDPQDPRIDKLNNNWLSF